MFTGRKDILERLRRFLDPSNSSVILKMQRIFVLYGLGGAGKTQIMSKFVIEFGDKYVLLRYRPFTGLT
jgi:signal recognition particle GTPase